MTESPAFLAERLKTEGEKTSAFFASLAPEQWNAAVYTEGGEWTVRSVLVHYVSAEQAFLKLFEDVRTGGPGAAEDFEIDRYNASQQEKNHNLTPGQLQAMFRAIRAEMTVWVMGLSPEDLQKPGRHPFLGQTTLLEMIKMVYRHNQIHHRDLRKTIAD